MTPARIAILMTCFNRRDLTLRCLASLAQQPGFNAADLFLVDDGSTDGTGDAVRALFPAAHVIAGDGELYWNGGMRLAWRAARAAGEQFEFYLWLNDDVELAAGTLAMLVADADAVVPRGDPVIVAAATTDPVTGELTYGAHRTANAARPLRMVLIEPTGRPVAADTISGNIVLVSAAAEALLGNMSPVFRHIYGDLDYGLRGRMAGVPVLLASKPGGTCAANSVAGTSLDATLPRLTRLRLRLQEERRVHARDWRRFVRVHGGGMLMVAGYALSPYWRILTNPPQKPAYLPPSSSEEGPGVVPCPTHGTWKQGTTPNPSSEEEGGSRANPSSLEGGSRAGLSMRCIGLLTASASRAGGGVFEAVVAQAAMIRSLGAEAVIFALADAYSDADRSRFAPSRVHLHSVTGPSAIGYAPELLASLLAANLDCLHLHGIWMYPSHSALRWARHTGRPYVISPHGMLDPWITARGRWKKALARAGYERAGWRAATAFHALTAAEADDIRRESGRSDVIVIPNAGPQAAPADTGPRAPQVVYIGRIHPKKNLAALVAGWRQARLPDGAHLTIAGWGEPHDVAAMRAVIGGDAGIAFTGPIYGAAKQALLAGARFTILPSLSEGLPMAVLEGWAAGAPAIITDACHLPEGFSAGAALRCTADARSLAQVLTHALHLDQPQWSAMAKAARDLAAGRFSADTVAAQWANAYSRLTKDAHEPA